MKKNILTVLLCSTLLQITTAQDNSSGMNLRGIWNPDSIATTSSGQKFNDIWGHTDCQGNEYAIIGSASMVHFVDITDTDNLMEIARFPGGDTTTWRDIKTYQDRAYAVSDATTEGLMIFDMSQLPSTITKTYHSNQYFNKAHNLFVDADANRLYVVGAPNADLLIFDLENAADEPVLISSLSLQGGYIHDIYVRDNIAYCSHLSSGLYIYDLNDPTTPLTLGTLTEYPGEVFNHSSWLSKDGQTLVFCDEKKGATVKALDVSDPTDMEIKASNEFQSVLLDPTATNSIAHNPYVRDQYAIVSYYHDGLQVFDISNPDSVHRVAYYDTEPNNTNYAGWKGVWGAFPYFPSGNIIASDMYNGLFVLNLSEISFNDLENDPVIDASVDVQGPLITCEGDEVTLEVAQGANNYIWYKDGTELMQGENSLTTNENGIYTVEIIKDYCNTVSEEIPLQFDILPDLSAMPNGEVVFCPGETVFMEAPLGFETYVWLKDGNAMENTGNFIQIVEGAAYRLVASNGGCTTISEEYIVAFTEIPSTLLQAEPSEICQGGMTVLSVAEGADEYTWYLDGEALNTSPDNTLTTNQPGEYSVELFVGQCSKYSEPINITEAPIFSMEIEADGNNLSTTIEGVNYQWYLNGELIEGATESTHYALWSGTYSVITTIASGCEYVSENFEIMVTSTNDIFNNQLVVYPNPVDEILHIKVNTEDTYLLNFNWKNLVGQQIFSTQRLTSGESLIQLELPDMPAGVYLLEIDNGQQKTTRRILKNSRE